MFVLSSEALRAVRQVDHVRGPVAIDQVHTGGVVTVGGTQQLGDCGFPRRVAAGRERTLPIACTQSSDGVADAVVLGGGDVSARFGDVDELVVRVHVVDGGSRVVRRRTGGDLVRWEYCGGVGRVVLLSPVRGSRPVSGHRAY